MAFKVQNNGTGIEIYGGTNICYWSIREYIQQPGRMCGQFKC